MPDYPKEFRAYVGDADCRSVTFVVKKQKSDTYLLCREDPSIKVSLHASGVHRSAEQSDSPRKPIERTNLVEMRDGEFAVVARTIFTTETDWSVVRGAAPKKPLRVEPPIDSDVLMMTLGFTPHHPQCHENTKNKSQHATIKIEDNKFITATIEKIPISRMINHIYNLHAPHWNSKLILRRMPVPTNDRLHDSLFRFRTKLNTHINWVHHNIPYTEINSWVSRNPIFAAFNDAAVMAQNGIYVGHDPDLLNAEQQARLAARKRTE